MKTKSISSLLFVVVIMVSIAGCHKDDPAPQQQLLLNSSVDDGTTPTTWFPYLGNNITEATWTDEAAFSGTKSLKISSTVLDPAKFSYWVQSTSKDIPIGKSITLKVKIKSNMTGTGASIVIRGDELTVDPATSQFISTQGVTTISGSFDWTDYTLTLDKVATTIKTINVFLIFLPSTKGEVYFDDITLVVN